MFEGVLEAFKGVLEAFKGVLEASESVLQPFDGVLEAFEVYSKHSRVCWKRSRVYWKHPRVYSNRAVNIFKYLSARQLSVCANSSIIERGMKSKFVLGQQCVGPTYTRRSRLERALGLSLLHFCDRRELCLSDQMAFYTNLRVHFSHLVIPRSDLVKALLLS